MALKKIGYYISKGKCVTAFALKKKLRSGKNVTKKVNYRRKAIKKGTKIYKTKRDCMKILKRKMEKKRRKLRKSSPKRKSRKSRKVNRRKSRFGQAKSCGTYGVPYFGQFVPSISKAVSGTPATGLTSSAWAWPTPPGALAYDTQQGGWMR